MTHFRTNCLENARHFTVSDEILRQLFLVRMGDYSGEHESDKTLIQYLNSKLSLKTQHRAAVF